MKKVTIGIPGYKSTGTHFGAGENNLEFIAEFGEPAIIMPHETDEQLKRYDMLYLSGGLDLNPKHYKSIPSYKSSNIDVFKENFYNNQLSYFVRNNIPIFGVCLGAQTLAAYFGGEITKNLPFHTQSPDRWEPAHNVFPVKACAEYDGQVMEVNSHHHQALMESGVPKDSNIIPLFFSKNEDIKKLPKQGDIIEAFTIKDKPIFGVQWHPEEFYDDFSVRIMEMLTKIASDSSAGKNK